jgi:hypothetical protein
LRRAARQTIRLRAHAYLMSINIGAPANRYGPHMKNEISFYSEELGREICCSYSAFGGLISVTTPDGRQKIAQLESSSSPVTLARKILIEMELEKGG